MVDEAGERKTREPWNQQIMRASERFKKFFENLNNLSHMVCRLKNEKQKIFKNENNIVSAHYTECPRGPPPHSCLLAIF